MKLSLCDILASLYSVEHVLLLAPRGNTERLQLHDLGRQMGSHCIFAANQQKVDCLPELVLLLLSLPS